MEVFVVVEKDSKLGVTFLGVFSSYAEASALAEESSHYFVVKSVLHQIAGVRGADYD